MFRGKRRPAGLAACACLPCLVPLVSSAAITAYATRSALFAEDFTVTATEDFSGNTVGTLIGDTPETVFVSGPFTISSSSRESGPYRATIDNGGNADNADGTVFAHLETFGPSHPNADLRNDSATIFIGGQNQVLGFDLGSFAEQTAAVFTTNLGNSVSFFGSGSIGSPGFAGAITDTPGEYFTRVDFVIRPEFSAASDGFGVDNMVAGTIPEPSLPLLLSFLVGMGVLKRRRS